jgi:hypothetical protein
MADSKKYQIKDGVIVGKVLSSKAEKFYSIRKIDIGIWTCDCMAYRFAKGPIGKKKPCTHMLKLWHNHKRPMAELESLGLRVLEPEAL